MSERTTRLLSEGVAPEWDEARSSRALAGARARIDAQRRARTRTITLLAAVLVGCFALGPARFASAAAALARSALAFVGLSNLDFVSEGETTQHVANEDHQATRPIVATPSKANQEPATIAPTAPSAREAQTVAVVDLPDSTVTPRVQIVKTTVGDVVELWLDDSDAARRSGDLERARSLLQKVLREAPRDRRVSVAAFTLGRLLLDELGEPAQAADAFARARTSAPEGPLAPDALAREADARSRAGNRERAVELADEYLIHFPQGPHRTRMERLRSAR